jgi:tricorn protease-like protein
MSRKREIGDCAYLKVPYLGYRYVEIVGFEHDGRIIVRITSGLEFTVHEDELEE